MVWTHLVGVPPPDYPRGALDHHSLVYRMLERMPIFLNKQNINYDNQLPNWKHKKIKNYKKNIAKLKYVSKYV